MGVFELSSRQKRNIIDSLDDTGGRLVKDSELFYWVEYYASIERDACRISVWVYFCVGASLGALLQSLLWGGALNG